MTSKGSRFVESAGYKLAAVALLAVVGGNPKHIQMQPPIGRTPTQSRQQNTIRRVHRKTDGFISGLCAICANAFQKLCFKVCVESRFRPSVNDGWCQPNHDR